MKAQGTVWHYLCGDGAPPHGAALAVERVEKEAWLRKKGRSWGAEGLADRLKGCTPLTRCRSGACPVCVGQTQVRLAKALSRQAAKSPGTPFMATIVPTDAVVPVGQLRGMDHSNMERRLKRALVDLPFDWMVGGFDFSLNEHAEGRYDPHWSPHPYLLGASNDVPGLRHGLSRRFPASDAVPRPVKINLWDGRWNALFYTLKVSAYRRVGVDDGERYDPRSGVMRACRNTEQQRLRSAERLELNLHLNDLGIGRRLFAARAQLHHGGRRIEIRSLNSW